VHQATPNELPRLGREHVARPRLTEFLEATDARVVLLIAPAGYGKTSLAVEWLAGKRAAWYRATSAAADVAAFSAGIAQAVTPLVPGAGQRLRQRLRGADLSDVSTESLAELLAEDLENWPADAWLAIDDYHLVRESRAVEEFLEHVLENTSVRLAVTARERPEWASARKILYGEIVELGVDELAMTDEETRLVLGDSPASDVTRFVERSEGWPALVAVARLFTSVDAPVSRRSGRCFVTSRKKSFVGSQLTSKPSCSPRQFPRPSMSKPRSRFSAQRARRQRSSDSWM
jgi:LuxR family maltose regulon positive regulatory protein